MKKYFTIKEAAAALGVSYWTVKDLVDEAYNCKRSRWKEGREFINLSTLTAKKRLIRIKPSAIGVSIDSAQNDHKAGPDQ